MRARGRKAKGKTIIEFCEDKCWNARPCWTPLAEVLNEKNNVEGKRKTDTRWEARSRLSKICIIFAMISQCVKSLPANAAYIHSRLHWLFTWCLAA